MDRQLSSNSFNTQIKWARLNFCHHYETLAFFSSVRPDRTRGELGWLIRFELSLTGLVGGLVLVTMVDSSFSRKNMLFFSCLIVSISSFLATFSANVWIYSVLKFLNRFGRGNVGTAALVLVAELFTKGWRGKLSVAGFFLFSIGFFTLSPLAYINQEFSWRKLYLWTSLPSIIYCRLVYFFVLESPRWLLIRGNKEEALKINIDGGLRGSFPGSWVIGKGAQVCLLSCMHRRCSAKMVVRLWR